MEGVGRVCMSSLICNLVAAAGLTGLCAQVMAGLGGAIS